MVDNPRWTEGQLNLKVLGSEGFYIQPEDIQKFTIIPENWLHFLLMWVFGDLAPLML